MSKSKPFDLNLHGSWVASPESPYDFYNFITDTIAIGDYRSSYEQVPIIVNANFPYNHVTLDSLKTFECKQDFRKHTVYSIGLRDSIHEPINKFIDLLMPLLKKEYEKRPHTKILFHCFAGKSRSVVLAISYLIEVHNMKLDDALKLVYEKRSIVCPNDGFMKYLYERYKI